MTTQTKTTWRKVRLEEVLELHRGFDLPIDKMKKGNYPVVFSNGKIEFHNEYKIKGPGVYTGRSGALGNVFYIEQDYWPHNTTLFVSNFKGNHPKFIYYLLKTINFENYNSGTGVPTLNRNYVYHIEINLPILDKQKRIAEILSTFDDKIELNNKINQNLEQMAQAIFKEWFISPSEKGKLSKKWEMEKLGEIATIEYGKGPSTKDFKKSGYPVYGANGIIGYSEKYMFENPQIIIGCRGVVGSLFKTLPKSSVTHNSLIINPIGFSEKNYLFMLLKNSNLQSVVGGSAQPQITIKDLSQMPILFTSQGMRQKFEEIVDKIEQKRLNIIYENQKLAAFRDLLLPKLMSGQIKI